MTNKISKSGGTKYWANKLGFGIKHCESELGDFYEKYAIKDILLHTKLAGYQNKVGYSYCINENDKIYKTYIIPSCHVYGQTQLGISAHGSSKWDKYKNRWEIFNTYNIFYFSLVS